ncbi:MAG: DUF4203 domain-containing protein [Candidatus Dojkabacteria bacterium]|nr:MAG: DUF4203 domain-containing protein [Candidatus Dojkabacteria bacterium]
MTLWSIFLGILLVFGGVFYAYFGIRVFKLFLPILALFAGIQMGMYLGDEAGFGSVFQFILAAVLGLGLALACFFIWKAAVVIAFLILGYSIAIFLLSLLGWNTPVLFMVLAIASAVVFGAFAIMGNLWNYLVVVVTAFQGAALAVLGVLAIFDKDFLVYLPHLIPRDIFSDMNPIVTILLVVALAVIAMTGMLFQVQANPEFERMEY